MSIIEVFLCVLPKNSKPQEEIKDNDTLPTITSPPIFEVTSSIEHINDLGDFSTLHEINHVTPTMQGMRMLNYPSHTENLIKAIKDNDLAKVVQLVFDDTGLSTSVDYQRALDSALEGKDIHPEIVKILLEKNREAPGSFTATMQSKNHTLPFQPPPSSFTIPHTQRNYTSVDIEYDPIPTSMPPASLDILPSIHHYSRMTPDSENRRPRTSINSHEVNEEDDEKKETPTNNRFIDEPVNPPSENLISIFEEVESEENEQMEDQENEEITISNLASILFSNSVNGDHTNTIEDND